MPQLTKMARLSAEQLIFTIERRKRELTRAFYDIGAALRELNDRKLWAALGYPSLDAMLRQRGLMSVAQARKLIEVARRFDRDMAQRLGAEKAYALARYVARTKRDDNVAELVEDGFPLGGKRKAIDDVTVRQITHATQVAVLRQKGHYSDNERARTAAHGVARRVHARLAKKTSEQATTAVVFRHGSFWIRMLVPAEMADAIIG